PAASLSVVPVMSVDDSGQLSSFSQRHTRAIAAPGRYIMSTVPDYIGNHNNRADDYASFSGTSMAAPYIAGASVLVREAMQFVGMTNITQDMIFNHLMTTADSVFDSATGQTYKRLNLNSAISTLMPSDDFGSSVATAHNLGAYAGTGTSTVSGILGRLDDTDFFRFTASASGSVSLSTASSDGTSKWVTSALGTFTQDVGTLSFNVVAGQTYTVGLAADSKVSHFQLNIHYSLASELPKTLTPAEKALALDQQLELTFCNSYSTNWGGIAEHWMRGANNQWYFITPGGSVYEWSGGRDLAGSRQIAQLDASFHLNPRLLHEASSTLTMPQLAQQLDQQLGLRFTGNYSLNWGGMSEKWMRGTGGNWYFIVPSGHLYRWNCQANLNTSTLIASLDEGYYANTSLLHTSVSTPPTSTVAQTQSANRFSTIVVVDAFAIAGAQWTSLPNHSDKRFKDMLPQTAVPSSRHYTELAFEVSESNAYRDDATTLSSLAFVHYDDDDDAENDRAHAQLKETHEVAVDGLFEKIGSRITSTQ
ncbi:MAG: S8 family serine peptidase, partial [Pirellulales bacterium]